MTSLNCWPARGLVCALALGMHAAMAQPLPNTNPPAATPPVSTIVAVIPAFKEGTHVIKNFRFHTGEVMPELRVAYRTLGDPANPSVLVLHGTAGSAQSMLNAGFGGAMFVDGAPLDANKYFIIIPDALGAGRTSKPSDGLKANFPKYNYDDMVDVQHRLVTEGLNIKRLRLVIGNSMGGMHTWVWGTRYPDMMDALAPMASQPTEMSSRNWMMRRLLLELISSDPDYKGGDYTSPPKLTRLAAVVYATGTNGGDLALQRIAPTRSAADAEIDKRLAAPFTADANDFYYQWASSKDYNPEPLLPKIKASVLVINSADDERNPPSTGLMDAAMKKVAKGRVFLIPGSAQTVGHGTTGAMGRLYAEELRSFLAGVPRP